MVSDKKAPDQSRVELHPGGGTSFVGRDAVNLTRAITLKASLTLYAKTGMIPTRNVRATDLLRMASEYTGKTYKRGQHELAAADVGAWVETMKAAIPVTTGRPKPVKRAELSSVRMVAGGEKTISTIIDGGRIKGWVGIGWIDGGPAQPDDFNHYPVVED